MSQPLLQIDRLTTMLALDGAEIPVVDRVSLDLARGSCLALVGESGCGKSMTALSVLGLVPAPPCRVEGGRVLFGGRDLLRQGETALRHLRGNRIAMVFQEPLTALNPVIRIGPQIAEVVRLHQRVNRAAARRRAIEVLADVGIPDPDRRYDDFPHQLSGGLRQRVVIAMALVCQPDLIIADEPTTALDVTVQAQIMALLHQLQHDRHMTMLLISHDLGIVAHAADQVAVMYAGRIVETAPVSELFARPGHPYTRGLLASLPRDTGEPLHPVRGVVPRLGELDRGCRFYPRCDFARAQCRRQEPELIEVAGRAGQGCQRVRCWLYA